MYSTMKIQLCFLCLHPFFLCILSSDHHYRHQYSMEEEDDKLMTITNFHWPNGHWNYVNDDEWVNLMMMIRMIMMMLIMMIMMRENDFFKNYYFCVDCLAILLPTLQYTMPRKNPIWRASDPWSVSVSTRTTFENCDWAPSSDRCRSS